MPFPVEDRCVELAETKLSVRFPEPHRRALLRRNGGVVEVRPGDFWELFPVKDDSDIVRLKRTWDDIVRQTTLARGWRGFPPAAIAIGHDGCGNKLVLVPEGMAELRLAVWDHENGQLDFVESDIFEE
ncbi:MAG: SMI1/KNR4 family protein [Planctomycetes bacterium]|nr:SMI1/KNR4 family protein [Planctomycetota bacterium]